jgi:phospholipid/cholesterol/gamma-HCH transport system substrate-binding protein
MLSQRMMESVVGLFLLLTATSLTVLAFKVSGLTAFFPQESYMVTAEFDDIGGLKTRAPVKIGGVQVGEVATINLDNKNFRARVKLKIFDRFGAIPDDSSAGIFTAGLLGDNYIAITPMYSQNFLKNGSQIAYTHSAMILEKLIGQFLYKVGNGSNDGGSDAKK